MRLPILLSSLAYILDAAEHFLTVCAKVNGEDESLVEFVEFHRIQGVTKFIFYAESTPHDRPSSFSTTQLRQLAEFYQQRGLGDLLSIEHTGSLLLSAHSINSELLKTSSSYHRVGQISAYRHCLAKYGENTEWLITLDADEFLTFPSEGPNETTVAEYLKELGKLCQREGPSTNMTDPFPLLSSPAAASLIRKLYDQRGAEWVPYVRNGTLGGIIISSAPYGSSGQFWNANNVLLRDPVSGVIELYFDPRDNLFYNATHLTKTASFPFSFSTFRDSYIKAATRVWETKRILSDSDWDEVSRSRLDEIFAPDAVELLISNNTESVVNFFQSKLKNDFPEIVSPLPFVPVLPLEELRGRHEASYMAPTLRAFEEDLDKLARLLEAKGRGATDDELDQLHEVIGSMWSVIYPLRLERSVWRSPTFASGDSLDEIRATISRLYPECSDWVTEAAKIAQLNPRIISAGDPWPPELLAKLPHKMCAVGHRGPNFPDYTQLGKTAYWVGEWRRRAPKSALAGKLESTLFFDGSYVGCQFPWIHNCGFRQPDVRPMVAARTNPLYDLRIDHHMLRSYFRRSMGSPTWRKRSTASYFQARGPKLREFEKFTNAVRDTSTRKWLPQLRASLRLLRPRPRLMKQELLHLPGRAVVRRSDILSVCDLGERISGARAMCPATFPSVAFALPRSPPPPSPLIAGGWCTDKNLTMASTATSLQSLLDVDLSTIHMCPGWPETSCCHHTQELISTEKIVDPLARPRNVTAWLLPNVCVQCAPLESS